MALKLKLPKTLEDLSLAGVNWEKSCNGRHTHTPLTEDQHSEFAIIKSHIYEVIAR